MASRSSSESGDMAGHLEREAGWWSVGGYSCENSELSRPAASVNAFGSGAQSPHATWWHPDCITFLESFRKVIQSKQHILTMRVWTQARASVDAMADVNDSLTLAMRVSADECRLRSQPILFRRLHAE